jgi:ADP-ribosylglycohydrolase
MAFRRASIEERTAGSWSNGIEALRTVDGDFAEWTRRCQRTGVSFPDDASRQSVACPHAGLRPGPAVIGAITGDFVGSVHEFHAPKHKTFPLFSPHHFVTDDSLLTVAVAEWLLRGVDLTNRFHDMVERYPSAGWGGMFARWARNKRREPYGSFGNGSAMRVSPVGWAFATVEETLRAAADSASVTHDHPEGIKGAQATALAVFLARTTRDKELIRREVSHRFEYDLSRTVGEIRPKYSFFETCQRTVPEAIVAFLEASDFEDAVRNAVSLGGDADTLAAIAGGIAHAYYGTVPAEVSAAALASLPDGLSAVWDEFRERFAVPA